MSTHENAPPLALTGEERAAITFGARMLWERHELYSDDESGKHMDTLRALLARADAIACGGALYGGATPEVTP